MMRTTAQLLVACVIAAATCRCDSGTQPDPSATDDLRIFMCMEGYPRSLLIMDPATFSVEDTVQLAHTPSDIEFSANFDKWYILSYWAMLEIDAGSKGVLSEVQTTGGFLATTSDGELLVSHGGNLMGLWSLDGLAQVHSESLKVYDVVPSPVDPGIIYGTYKLVDPTQKGLYGIFEYDTRSFSLKRTMQVDPALQPYMMPHDLKISNDGDVLFLTVYVYGIERAYFYVLDVKVGGVVAKHRISGWAQMALSPDGRYVYITDPGGYMDMRVIPQGIVRRYDIEGWSMQEFLDLRHYLETGSVNPPMSDQIVIMPDNKTVFVSNWQDGLMKWDFENKTLLQTMGFNIKRGQLVRILKLGRKG